jgi:hypothetical protein
MHQNTELSNNFRVNFATKTLVSSPLHNANTQQHSGHTVHKSKHANDKLFHIYRKLIFGSRLRFLYTSTATTAGKRDRFYGDMHSKNYESATLGEIKQIRTRFTPNKWLQLLLPVTTVSSENMRPCDVSDHLARQTDLPLSDSAFAFVVAYELANYTAYPVFQTYSQQYDLNNNVKQ